MRSAVIKKVLQHKKPKGLLSTPNGSNILHHPNVRDLSNTPKESNVLPFPEINDLKKTLKKEKELKDKVIERALQDKSIGRALSHIALGNTPKRYLEAKTHYNPNEKIPDSYKKEFENIRDKVRKQGLLGIIEKDIQVNSDRAEIVNKDKEKDKIIRSFVNDKELGSVKNYTEDCSDINGFLRQSDDFLIKRKKTELEIKKIKEDIKNIDLAVEKAPPIKEQIVKHDNKPIIGNRIVTSLEILEKDDLFSKFPTFLDLAYASTTIEFNYSVSSKYFDRKDEDCIEAVMYVIVTRKGLKILPSYSFPTNNKYEFEFLLPRLSMFKTLGYTDIIELPLISNQGILGNTDDNGNDNKHEGVCKYELLKWVKMRFVLLEQLDQSFKIEKDLYNMATGEKYKKDTKIFKNR